MAFQPPQAAQPMQWQMTSQVSANQGIKCLVYGGAGRGKTRLCATAPAPCILSAESGLLSLQDYNIPYLGVSSYDQLVQAYNYFAGSNEPRQLFQTICIDSISEIAEQILGSQKGEEAAKRNPNFQRAYGEMAEKVMHILRLFRDLPGYHVYFSAKMGRTKDEGTGGLLWGPMMPGQQLDQQLPYFTDEVFHIERYPNPALATDPNAYPTVAGLRTYADNQYQAKDRSGRLAPLEYADLSAIFQKIAAPRPVAQ